MFDLVLALGLECGGDRYEVFGRCVCRDQNADSSTEDCACNAGYFRLAGKCTPCPAGSVGKDGSCECGGDSQSFDELSGLCVCTDSGRVLVGGECVLCNETLDPETGRCVCADRKFDWYADPSCRTLLVCDFGREFANASGQCEACGAGVSGAPDHVSCTCQTGKRYDYSEKTCVEIVCDSERGEYLTSAGECAPCPADSEFDA